MKKFLDDALVTFIEEQRLERRWSQQELAERLGMTQAMLSRWLAGKRRIRNLQWYADVAERAFGIPLSLLVAKLERRQAEAAMAQDSAAPDLLDAAHAAYHALKSYEFGNASPDLAQECAAALEAAINKAESR